MVAKKASNEIANVDDARSLSRTEGFTDAELRGITTFEEAFSLAESIYGDVVDVSEELGNGFTLVSDKSVLENKPFVILSCGFNEGDYGDFVSIAAVTKDNEKYIFNDGSSGVFKQLFELVRTLKRTGGFLVPGGLRSNEYPTCTGCGRGRAIAAKECPHEGCGDKSEKRASATTYYLGLSAE